MQDGSKEFLNFILKFLEKYPQFKDNSLVLTGESYAGKYLPLFTHELLEYNKNATDKINLTSTLIIDPYPSPVIQETNRYWVPYALNFIDDNNMR